MATETTNMAGLDLAHTRTKQPLSGLRFDWLMIVLSTYFLTGLAVDGWAHAHVPQLETFFTPWHAIFYSGFLIVALGLGVTVINNHRHGYPWLQAIPAGYELSVLGLGIFAVGGVGDMIWHILFGIEVNVEAVLSPTHLILATGMALILTGPLRAAWQRPDAGTAQGWRALLPAILSLTLLFSLLTFFTEYAHPFVSRWALAEPGPSRFEQFYMPVLGIASILLQSAILMSFVLFLVRRWRLPIGTFTLIFTLNMAVMSVFTRNGLVEAVPVALLAGIVADVLYQTLKPSEERAEALRVFAFAVPMSLYLLYFLSLLLIGAQRHQTITWSIHLWLGSTVIAGIIGLLLSYLMIPPRKPAQ